MESNRNRGSRSKRSDNRNQENQHQGRKSDVAGQNLDMDTQDASRTRKPGSQSNASNRANSGRGGGK